MELFAWKRAKMYSFARILLCFLRYLVSNATLCSPPLTPGGAFLCQSGFIWCCQRLQDLRRLPCGPKPTVCKRNAVRVLPSDTHWDRGRGGRGRRQNQRITCYSEGLGVSSALSNPGERWDHILVHFVLSLGIPSIMLFFISRCTARSIVLWWAIYFLYIIFLYE